MKESLSPYIDSFLTMIAVEKGLAKNTVEAYSRDLVRLSEFLLAQSVASWEETQTVHLRSYLSSLRREGLSARSIGRHAVTVRRFYGFLETEGGRQRESRAAIPFGGRGGRKLPQTLSAHDVRKLLAQPNPQEPLGVRDQAMLELLYATGLRVSELIALQMQQISFQGNFLTVKGKGSKVRAVSLREMGPAKVTRLCQWCKTATGQGVEPAFLYLSAARAGL